MPGMRNILLFTLLFVHFLLPQGLAQQVFRQNQLFGIIDANGIVAVPPDFDSIYKPAGSWMFFVLKKGHKYAYAIRHDGEIPVRWSISQPIYDTLYIHSGYTDKSVSPYQAYTVLACKQNTYSGIITVAHKFSSDDDLFTTSGRYYDVAAVTTFPVKYTRFYRDRLHINPGDEYDNIYTTEVNGKYGFLDIVGHFEIAPVFDTIPLFAGPRKRYVRLNGRWGLIRINNETTPLEYEVPCMCNGLGALSPGFYFCKGQYDTLQIYALATKQIIFPKTGEHLIETGFFWPYFGGALVLDGYIGRNTPIRGTTDLYYDLRVAGKQNNRAILLQSPKYANGNDSMDHFCFYGSNSYADRLTAINLSDGSTVFSFTDTTARYDLIDSLLVTKATYNSKKKKFVREFYDAQTGAYRFKIVTSDFYLYVIRQNGFTGNTKSFWYEFRSAGNKTQQKNRHIGVYDIDSGKFKKRKKR